jgi:TorA maturation chaperone TorD
VNISGEYLAAGERAQVYGLLGLLMLGPPDACKLRALLALAEHFGLAEPGDREISPVEAERVYMRFLGLPGPEYLRPYESVYREGSREGRRGTSVRPKGLLWGASTVRVCRAYERAGFRLAAGVVPDHLGVELLFLAELCRAEAAAEEADGPDGALWWRERQREFLHDHLLPWVYEVQSGLASGGTAYGRLLARVLGAFVGAEARELGGDARV